MVLALHTPILDRLQMPVKGVISLKREPYDEYVLVAFPDGSSEEVEGVLLEQYLTQIGVRDANRIADRVWNFYKAAVKL